MSTECSSGDHSTENYNVNWLECNKYNSDKRNTLETDEMIYEMRI